MILSSLRPGIRTASLLLALSLPATASAQQVEQLDYDRDERFRGLVKPTRQVTLGAPTDGIVGELRVQEHDVVSQGDVVVQMDDAVQQVSVAAAKLRAEDKTEIERQRLLLAEAEIQLERMEELYERDAAQDWEVRRSKLQRDATEAELKQAKHARVMAQQSYKVEQERLAQLSIKAPFDGQIMRISSEAGASLRHGDGILQMMAMHPLEAELYLPVQLYGELEVGKEYELAAEGPVNRTLTGRLKSIEPVIDSASHTFRVLMTVDNEDLSLPVGFTVRLLWPQVGPTISEDN